MKIWIATGIVFAAIITGGLFFTTAAQEISSQTILETNSTVIGQKITYPLGEPLVTSSIVTIPTGAETGFHVHEYPMYAYILEGQITVDYQEIGTKTYLKGDSLVEAIHYEHNGKNTGNQTAKILVVLMGQQ